MNWDAAEVIVEFAGLVIVVFSLFYLAKQIRQNSSLMELQQIQSTTANRLAVYALQIEPQMADVIGRTYVSDKTGVELSPSDVSMMEGYLFSYMEIVQSRFAEYEKGFLDESSYEVPMAIVSSVNLNFIKVGLHKFFSFFIAQFVKMKLVVCTLALLLRFNIWSRNYNSAIIF